MVNIFFTMKSRNRPPLSLPFLPSATHFSVHLLVKLSLKGLNSPLLVKTQKSASSGNDWIWMRIAPFLYLYWLFRTCLPSVSLVIFHLRKLDQMTCRSLFQNKLFYDSINPCTAGSPGKKHFVQRPNQNTIFLFHTIKVTILGMAMNI